MLNQFLDKNYTLQLPKLNNRHVVIAIFYGVILLIWLSTESNNMIVAALLGIGSAIVLTALICLYWLGEKSIPIKLWMPGLFVIGGLVGMTAVLTTFMLMLFKNVQHSHLYPDFPNETLIDLLARLPAWGLVGVLLGGATALASIALYNPDEINTDQMIINEKQ